MDTITKNKKENFIKTPIQMARSYCRIDLSALAFNVKTIQGILPDSCRIMAIVKANAYGHGDLPVSEHLNKLGIRDFAVATLEEGIRLREAKIHGNILILGHTPSFCAPALSRWHLTQTVTDYQHARELQDAGLPLDVHIKIDTGMHRLGISPDHFDDILDIFSMDHLRVTGMFTHLCAADSSQPDDIAFTRGQIRNFFTLEKKLEHRGIHVPIHIQSSYGILNYPGLPCEFARPGIILYGCYSDTSGDLLRQPALRPVLSLHSRIASIRQIHSGESVGYGRTWHADSQRRLAVLPIGYADGYPRALSNKGSVLIHGQKAPVVGRICMDQMTVDITDIPQAAPGDIATLIGKDGQEEIRAEEVAVLAGTITNELLSRLGSRLHRVTVF